MFRLFGFDVRVRTGFLIFLGLIVFLYQDSFGLWLAAGIAGFTLLHELGHAIAARSAGAEASISLDFLAGYTSYRPRPGHPLTPAKRAGITAAGPAIQIIVSVGVLVVMGINPVSFDSVTESDAALAIWWAGPVIGVLNLIPVLPLDGGHIVLTGLQSIMGERAVRTMVIASLVITGGGAIALFGTGRGGFAIFVAFLLINQFQLLQATSTKPSQRPPATRLAEAESAAWQAGQPGILEPGQRLSPWYQAHRALARGDRAVATAFIVDDLASAHPPRWSSPSILALLPAELPTGNPYSSQVLADILLALGEPQRAGEHAAKAFAQHRSSPLATQVARAAAQTGETEIALQWLRAAATATHDEPAPFATLLGSAMDRAPEMAALRATAEFRSVRAELG